MKSKSLFFLSAIILFAAFVQSQRAMALPEFSADRYYKLKHVNSGRYLLLHDEYTETNVVNATTLDDEGSMFTVSQSGSGYVFTKMESDKTLSCSTNGNLAKWNTSNTGAKAWSIVDAGEDYVYITSDKGYLGPNESVTANGSYIYTNQEKRDDVKWQIIDATDHIPNYVSSITSGNYYRLISNAYAGKTMTENTSGGLDLANTALEKGTYAYYSQLWQITGSNGTYKFINLASGKSIQAWPGKSQQWKTGATAANFYSATITAGENTVFWFATVNDTIEHKSLHAAGASDQNNTVVGWQASSDASKWILWQVEITDDDIAAAEDWRKLLDANTGNKYLNFFTDKACSQLKAEYASMTDDELKVAMSEMPAMLRNEAIKVKNNKWSNNATWSKYEKDFRIHDYEPYSAPGVWGSKLGFGDCTRLTQPTGIRVKPGEIIYLFVNDNVKDSNAELYVDQVEGINTSSSGQKALKKGCNILTPNSDSELFITYLNTNTEKPLSYYPDIKIHIIGGTCNGTFDIVRGHDNNDWTWLKQNMLKHTYLHIRTENHLYCAYLKEVKPIASNLKESLQMLDYCYATIERTMSRYYGTDYYRPVVIIKDHGWGINPNGGNGLISWPGINDGYMLNYNTILNAGWWPCWAYPHEHGHLVQRPLWMAAMREISNEGLVQIYTHEWGRRTAKGSQTKLATCFNQGDGWVDIIRKDALLPTMVWYQLWLYFKQKGDMEFFPRWIECIKKRGMFQSRFSTQQNPARIDKDYMRLALAACEASQTDLYEFFKAWGFFNYAEDVNGADENGIVHLADYEHYYLKIPRKSVPEEVELMESWKQEMQSYPNKAPGVMFINSSSRQRYIDENDGCAKFDPSLIGKAVTFYENDDDRGCTGFFQDYGKNEANSIGFRRSGTTIAITGSGAVGYKIYDENGELIFISYKNTFATNSTISAAIGRGTYSLVASLGDDTDLLLSGPPTDYATNTPTDISSVEKQTMKDNNWYTTGGVKLSGRPSQKGIYIVNGKKVVIR